MKVLCMLLLVAGCATQKPQVVKVEVPKEPVTWSEMKRECHTFYLNKFGLSKDDSIAICKEELERKN